LVSPALLQVEWGVVPGPSAFLAEVGRHTRVLPAAQQVREFTHAGAANREEQDGRVLELAEAGQMVAAIRLARELRGYDLAQAKAFVEALCARKGGERG
jgi:ribosomal protein L7/L12